jgi:hypothetical protein
MKKFQTKGVARIFDCYPRHMREKLMFLRKLVFDTALETEGVGEIEETTKWGEPSYIAKGGSAIRIDWKQSNPTQYAMYFHCKTKLVDTFRELYRDKFRFEGNRAIVFDEKDDIPINELKHCISLSLTYHRRKKLPMLGA